MDSRQARLNSIFAKHAGTRVNGRVASQRTESARRETITACFNRLKKLGFDVQNPENIGAKHIKALCEYWYANKYAPKTIQENLSNLRLFCRWIGKGNLVQSVNHYLPNVPPSELRVKTSAETSKSWAEHGIDVAEKIRDADALDWRFGLMLRLAVAFGLRRMEILQCIPWKVDRGDRFAAYKTKGGRPRDIYIETAEQRKVLDDVKARLKKNEHLGWPTRADGSASDLKYCLGKWHKMLAKIGISREHSCVTGHGLRAQYAENAALIASVIPPTLGGTAGQMPKEDLELHRLQVSELLGHSRISVTRTYFGSFRRDDKPDSPDRTKESIEAALIPPERLRYIALDRLSDCLQLTTELAIKGAYVEPRVVQVLWEHHSSRHATDWVTLGKDNVAALEAAANYFAKPM